MNETVTTFVSQFYTNNGHASFSIRGTAEVGNTLSIMQDTSDPDGMRNYTYSWQTSTDGETNWNVVGIEPNYTVAASEDGKYIKAVISYQDWKGFDEIVTTSASQIYTNNGHGSFSIRGIPDVGQTLFIREDSADPNGTGTLSYKWQSSEDNSTWTQLSTNESYVINSSDQGKYLRATISYKDQDGFQEQVFTETKLLNKSNYVEPSYVSYSYGLPSSLNIFYDFGTSGNDNFQSINKLIFGLAGDDYFDAQNVFTGDTFFVGGSGNDTYHIGSGEGAFIYELSGQGVNDRLIIEDINVNSTDSYYLFLEDHLVAINQRSGTTVFLANIRNRYGDYGIDYVQLGNDLYNSQNLVQALSSGYSLGYLGYYNIGEFDVLSGGAFSSAGITSGSLRSFLNEITSFAREIEKVDIWSYLASNSDLLNKYKSDIGGAYFHYFNYGIEEGRIADNFDELRYLASNPDLIKAFGTNTNLATQHYVKYGFDEGREAKDFNAAQYLNNNSDLFGIFENDLNAAVKHYISYGHREGRSDSATILTDLEALKYIASNPDLIKAFGNNINKAKSHYGNYGRAEGRSLDNFNPTNYLNNNSDLSAAFGSNKEDAIRHYISYGYREGRSHSASSSSTSESSTSESTTSESTSTATTSTSPTTLTDFQALKYIASNPDLIKAFGNDINKAKSHYRNYGRAEGRSLDNFNPTNYLNNNSDLSAAFGSNKEDAIKHYISYGYREGRRHSASSSSTSESSTSESSTSESSTSESTSTAATSTSPTTLTDFQALQYIASNPDLIRAFGNNINKAKSHYSNYGREEGRPLDNFDELGYLASNNDLMNAFGSDTTKAINHYISFGMQEGRVTNLFNVDSYLNNNADLGYLRNDNYHDLAKMHFIEIGFTEGRVF